MKKISLLIFSVIAFSITTLYANPIDNATAKQVGEKFIKSSTILGQQRNDIQSNHVYTFSSTDNQSCMYVYNIVDGGFVVVSAEDRVKPILAYATEGTFKANDLSDGFLSTLTSFKEEIEYVRNNNIALTDDIAMEWESVRMSGKINENRNSRTVEPLLGILWNQGQYYNNLCPEDPEGPGGHVYAGCVATAMSMVMKYWNHPVQGTGSHSYNPGGWGYPNYPVQTANFGETFYHFEMMPSFLDSTSTEEEIFYVAQLQHHCGIAVEMMYSPDGSGAYSEDVPGAMIDYFGYAPEMSLYYKDYYSTNQWIQMLKNELDLAHPIYYSGQDDSGQGGHAFICDGYDENEYFHFNWGWSGRDNAFCAMGALNTTRYAFNSSNSALFGCVPVTENYFSRPQKVDNFSLTESNNHIVYINWTNPTEDLSGYAPILIDSVIIRRDFEVIATIGNVSPGEEMDYMDTVPEDGVYEYSVFVKNSAGYGKPVYQKIMVGEKCDLIFELNDESANGWRGASISVVDENGRRIEVITMDEGETEIRTVSLLKSNLSFIWNTGWYSAMDDHEISFTVSDVNEQLIFSSPDSLISGLLFTYDNNTCVEVLQCVRPTQLSTTYVWNSEENFGVEIGWSLSASNLQHFNIYRSTDNIDFELISTVDATSDISYTYFDVVEPATYYYMVKAYYELEDQSCESEPALTVAGEESAIVVVTTVPEDVQAEAQVYPNPSDGKISIKAAKMNQLKVFDIVGQEVLSFDLKCDFVTIEMGDFENGIYFVRIYTEFGEVTKKIVLFR